MTNLISTQIYHQSAAPFSLLFFVGWLLGLGQDYCFLLLWSADLVLCCVALRRSVSCLRARCWLIDLWQLCCDFFEKFLNICSCLGTDFLEEHHVPISQVFSLRLRDISILKVHLIPEQRNDNPIASLILDIIDPLLHALEGSPIGDIINDNSNRGVSNIIGNQ